MIDALDIMIKGKNKHFDGKIVDIFLDIPCDVIMDVLISEYNITIKNSDRKILSKISLKNFSDILRKNQLTNSEKKVIEVFNSYYKRNNNC